MKIDASSHLTYCSNIHAGETWSEVRQRLEHFLPPIKAKVSPHQPLGLGLRLSNQASLDLMADDHLPQFKNWLASNELYVFTMNGFPYGSFHGTRVKAQVHHPDWQTPQRLDYTLRLFGILSELLPEGVEGGISTSPLTYKYWLTNKDEVANAYLQSTEHLIQLAHTLYQIHETTGQILHLNIEPEPDGLLENTKETIHFFQNWLLPLAKASGLFPPGKATDIVLRHINVCYDVCHFAVAYEEPVWVFQQFAKHQINIGKIQISAALKVELSPEVDRQAIIKALEPFNESTYLHQVIARANTGIKTNFRDLSPALDQIFNPAFQEWRTHFHVPIFVENYGDLSSTQSAIRQVLDYQRQTPVTKHLEIETYTWEVLPKALRLDLGQSIERELLWVLEYYQGKDH